jgi:uncharacterized membrane protein YbaN (DUF454 family)
MKTYEYLDIFREERVEPQAEKKSTIIAMFVYLNILIYFVEN